MAITTACLWMHLTKIWQIFTVTSWAHHNLLWCFESLVTDQGFHRDLVEAVFQLPRFIRWVDMDLKHEKCWLCCYKYKPFFPVLNVQKIYLCPLKEHLIIINEKMETAIHKGYRQLYWPSCKLVSAWRVKVIPLCLSISNGFGQWWLCIVLSNKQKHFGTQTMHIVILKPFSFDKLVCTTLYKLKGKNVIHINPHRGVYVRGSLTSMSPALAAANCVSTHS